MWALFVIVDPIGPVPIFANLTRTMTPLQKRKVFRTAILVGAILLVAFALVGQEILILFGITLPSFQVAGGLVLLLLSIEIIFRGESSPNLKLTSVEETAVFPIAFPFARGSRSDNCDYDLHPIGRTLGWIDSDRDRDVPKLDHSQARR